MRRPLDSYKLTQTFSKAHPAEDLAAEIGTPILAPESGVIVNVNNNPSAYFGGRYVVLMGDSGLRHYLGHNSKNLVATSMRRLNTLHSNMLLAAFTHRTSKIFGVSLSAVFMVFIGIVVQNICSSMQMSMLSDIQTVKARRQCSS